MEEQLVSFKVAKLAKDKGFNENCCFGFDNNIGNEQLSDLNYTNSDDLYLMQPTQSLLQKWLRETHNIHVQILIWSWLDKTYCYRIHSSEHYISSSGSYLLPDEVIVGTYEDTLEKGLRRALELIK